MSMKATWDVISTVRTFASWLSMSSMIRCKIGPNPQ
jgi:hypothetical protein